MPSINNERNVITERRIAGIDVTIEVQTPITPKDQFVAGLRVSLPFLVSALPMGVIGGMLGVASGLSDSQSMMLSAILNSGTAQFLAIRLLQEHANLLVIMLTILVLSLRMLIYGLALRSHVRGLSFGWRVILGFGLIDAVFFAVMDRLKSPNHTRHWHWFFVGVSSSMYLGWIIATAVGVMVGNSIPDGWQKGLDFPLIAMFGAMLGSTLGNRKTYAVMALTAVLAVLTYSLPYHLGLIVAALGGAFFGAGLDRLEKSSSLVVN